MDSADGSYGHFRDEHLSRDEREESALYWPMRSAFALNHPRYWFIRDRFTFSLHDSCCRNVSVIRDDIPIPEVRGILCRHEGKINPGRGVRFHSRSSLPDGDVDYILQRLHRESAGDDSEGVGTRV